MVRVLRLLTLVSLGAASVVIGTSSARAAIMETFTFDPTSGYGSEDGTSFSAFNPALGTLDSVTIDYTAVATFSGGGALDMNQAVYDVSFAGPGGPGLTAADASILGNGTAEADFSGAPDSDPGDPGDLALLRGAGDVTISVEVRNLGDTPASIGSAFDTESVTYNYTPAAPVPEPGSLAPLSGGLIGLVALRGRRLVQPS